MSSSATRAIADLTARLALLESHVQALMAAKPRDTAESRLRQVLARSTKGLPFVALDLCRHAGVDRELRHALIDAMATTPGEVGCWLRANVGTRDGVTIERLGRRRWLVTYTVIVP